MTESIWIAIIGAVGVIGAAIIGLFKKSDKSKSNAKTTVNQTVTGNHNTGRWHGEAVTEGVSL